jgi:hypothetical protein
MYNLRGRSLSREPAGADQESQSSDVPTQTVTEAKPSWKQRLRKSSLARRTGKENEDQGACCRLLSCHTRV